jgi:hypothetical protein
MDDVNAQERARKFIAQYGTLDFPPPPLSGNSVIEPITDCHELMQEGESMRHCVASYAQDVMRGSCCIYRVLQPERASLEIKIDKARDALLVGQFRLSGNSTPAVGTRRMVDTWMRKAMESRRRRCSPSEKLACAAAPAVPRGAAIS